MNWTIEKPKENGYYWLRNYQITGHVELNRTPVIVDVYSSFGETPYVSFTGNDNCFSLDQFTGGEWLGPLTPDAIEKQKERDAQDRGGMERRI